jgi:Ca-activated chloride channel family protein
VNPALLAHPEWLGGLAWIGAACALALWTARLLARRRRLRLLGGRAPALAPILRSDAALLTALVAIGVALVGPRIGERALLVPSTGVDVVFLVDLSRSMDARDVPPSRLDRARRAVEEILARLAPRDRAALAAFAGHGLLLTPLTPDRNALVDLLAGLDTQIIQPATSHLGEGVRAALEAFEAGSRRPRVVFVASDGEDPDRRSDLGAADAARRRVRVITAALGSEIGSHVPDGARPLRTRGGATVVSRRRADRLARLAAGTDGESFVGDEWGRIDFDRAAAAIRRDAAAAEGEPVERRVRAVRVAPFATLAFVLLLVEGLPRPRRARWHARGAVLVCAALGAALLGGAVLLAGAARGADPDGARGSGLLGALEARVRMARSDARSHLDLGLARLERGRSEAAARAFLAAAVYAREAEVAAVAYYDLGVAALLQGDFEAARDAFFDALAFDPSDRAARFNLEWTLQALRRRPPAPMATPEEAEIGEQEEADARPTPPDDAPREAPQEPRAEVRASEALEPPPLTAEQRRRWLERAADDPRQWLRAAARGREDARRRPAGPAW